MKDNDVGVRNRNIEKTLKSITKRKELPKLTIIIFILLYAAVSFFTSFVARSKDGIMLGEDFMMPISLFAGVLTALSNTFIIFMVLFYKKLGFIISLVILVSQIPIMVSSLIIQRSAQSIPGVFTDLFAIIMVIIIFINNVKIEKYQKRIQDQAVTDRLTGLPNRYACSELVNGLIRQDKKFAIVSIDINNFKGINNTMGQELGNEVLTVIAERWKKLAESGETGTVDIITRQSGDEFSLLIRGYYSESELMKTIRRYEEVLMEKITADECDLYITASFGYAEYPADADSCDALMSCADAARHEVKRVNSSDRVLRFAQGMLKEEYTLETESKIREALENDTFYFNLQPQFDMDHKLRGFEALARMKDSEGNFVSPGEFIPAAEEVGLIDKVDSTVFRKAAFFFGELMKKTDADITLSINVSVRHMMKNNFLKEVREILETSGVSANHLEIEITESIMIDSAGKALSCINELKKMGIKIAIDDFGTGFSSLSYLHKFPADLLKIDKSFIDKMNSGESSKQYVASIISIGHIMGLDVISEGVEEQDQLETLRSIGCDYIQGYIWGRPLPKEEAEKLVLEGVKA